ncbi:MAG: SRPBCC domain-containing protein [Anaerolineales bacterium]|nr:SRPBCC domain-containing protein [Anaerolineales bacterium]
MITSNDTDHVVTKSITVEAAVEWAFRVWTEQIRAWWPVSHSRSGDPQAQVFMEGRVGGRFYERASDGVEYDWGEVVDWEPPHRLAFTWYLGSSRELPTRVEIRFVALAERRTRLDLEHRGPELIGDLWGQRQRIFSASWDSVLARFGAFLVY